MPDNDHTNILYIIAGEKEKVIIFTILLEQIRKQSLNHTNIDAYMDITYDYKQKIKAAIDKITYLEAKLYLDYG
jgi:hypothetical protein